MSTESRAPSRTQRNSGRSRSAAARSFLTPSWLARRRLGSVFPRQPHLERRVLLERSHLTEIAEQGADGVQRRGWNRGRSF
jgi:transposase